MFGIGLPEIIVATLFIPVFDPSRLRQPSKDDSLEKRVDVDGFSLLVPFRLLSLADRGCRLPMEAIPHS